jgi:hypoxanthine phosphoribosyltransferase
MDLEPRISEQEIRNAVGELARRISADYEGKRPLLVGVLKGSFIFLADLVRELTVPAEIDFVRARSYGSGQHSSGAVQIVKDVETELAGRHVIVVEDIADTGMTMEVVVKRIQVDGPASVKRCALLVREGCTPPDYVGLTVGPGFVVGYGLDHAEEYRGLRDIRAIDES